MDKLCSTQDEHIGGNDTLIPQQDQITNFKISHSDLLPDFLAPMGKGGYMALVPFSLHLPDPEIEEDIERELDDYFEDQAE